MSCEGGNVGSPLGFVGGGRRGVQVFLFGWSSTVNT